MRTFEESVANFATPDLVALAEQKKTFEPVLAELKKLEREFPKHKTTWFSRIEMVNRRRHLALAKGVTHTRLTYLLNELSGTPGKVGMLEGTENMLAHYIARIMQFSLRDLPQRQSWLHLYTAPDRIRDNVQAIEDYLAEALVKDGGELHRMLQGKSMQPASASVQTKI
jgi:hypothetical protein